MTIDLKSLEAELHHARLARIETQEASSDVEDLIRHVQHFEPGRGRLLFMVDTGEWDLAAPA